MDIVKIIVICIICAMLSRVVFQTNQELSIIISIAGVLLVSFNLLNSISNVISKINNITNTVGIETQSIGVAFKALGICYICELSSSSCRDCGESALGGVIDISGKVAISLICLPLIDKLMEVIKSIMEM